MTDYDPETAHVSIINAGAITNKEERRLIVATQTALALVDIAESLRVLADAERFALVEAGVLPDIDAIEPEPDAVEPVDLTDADAGTRVRLVADPDKLGELTGTGGVDQGIPWVGVIWYDGVGLVHEDAPEQRVFVPHLEAVHAPTVRLTDDELAGGVPAEVAPTDGLDALKAAKTKSKGKGKR